MDQDASELERAFPHIIAELVRRWGTPAANDYLDGLMLDTRGGRRGFPHDVMQAIVLLRDVHHTRDGARSPTPWDFTV